MDFIKNYISVRHRYSEILFLCVFIANILCTASVQAGFNTIAGKAEPNKLGQLLIAFSGVDGKQEEREFSVYYSGPDNKITDTVFVGRTGHPASLVAGAYDVKIPVHPTLWIRDVVIENGKTTDLAVGGYGRVLINGKDSTGKPLENDFGVYTHDDKKDIVIRGITNEPSEYILAGTYDIKVDTEPRIFKEAVRIEADRDTVLDLPQSGRLEVRGKNALGELLKTNKVLIYMSGERASPSVHSLVNSPGELQPGIYDVRVDVAPEVWFERVEIVSGEERVIDLPELGRLMIQGKDTKGVPLNGYGYSVYKPENSEKEIAAGDINVAKDLLPGVYDVKVDFNPEAWFRGIEIVAGNVKVIDVPPPAKVEVPPPAKVEAPDKSSAVEKLLAEQGRIQILGKNARGNPLESYYKFYVYAPGDKEKWVAEESVRNPVDLPSGVYDVRVEFRPDIWFESVEVVVGQNKVLELPLPGRLDVRGKDALGKLDYRGFTFTVYASGRKEKPLVYQYVNWYKDLPAGVYDIQVNLNPEVWYEGIKITAGESRVINLPAPGRLEIRGTDAVGASRDVPFSVYTDAEREKAVTDGVVNTPLEIQPGVYDIKVALETDEKWFNGVEIVSRQSNILELAPPGRIWIYGRDEAGEPLSASFAVYADGEREKETAVGRLNETVDLPAGAYDVKIGLEPEVWYKAIKIVGGQIRIIDLSRPPESMVPDKEIPPEEKVVDTEPRATIPDVPSGRLEVRGKDSAGEPLSGYSFDVYARRESEERITFGDVNSVKEIPPGTYDIRVDLVPEAWYERVEIKEGETAVIELPELGKLEVIGKDASGGPVSERFFVYNSGERENSLVLGEVNVSSDLQSGVYDIKITSKPPAWYEGIEITAGQSTVINLSRTGILDIRGMNAIDEPLTSYFFVYVSGDRDKSFTTGNVNEAEDLLPGTYDIEVALDPHVWYEGVKITAGQNTMINLPQTGRIEIRGKDAGDEPIRVVVWVYAPGDRNNVLSSIYTNDPLDIWEGTYDIVVNLNPDVQYEGIEIVAGQTKVINLTETGNVQLTAVPEEGAEPFKKIRAWHIYPVGTDGKPAEKYIDVSYYNPSGIFTLPPGRYHATITIGKGSTKTEFEVKLAETTEKTVVVDTNAEEKEQEKVQDAGQEIEQESGQGQEEVGILYINSTFRIAVTSHPDWEMKLMPGSRVPEIKAAPEQGGKSAFIDSVARRGSQVLFLKKPPDGEKPSGSFKSNILLAVHDVTKSANDSSAEAWIQNELVYTRKHFPTAEITVPPSQKDLNGKTWLSFELTIESTAGEKLELKQMSYVHLKETGGRRYIYVFAATALQSEFETDRQAMETIIHSADLFE